MEINHESILHEYELFQHPEVIELGDWFKITINGPLVKDLYLLELKASQGDKVEVPWLIVLESEC